MTDSNSQTALFDAPEQPATTPAPAPRPLTWEDFKPGDRVRFSDGTPPPPARFNKKLEAWNRKNWIGTVINTRPPCTWAPRGFITCTNDRYPPSSVITFEFTEPVSDRVRLIDGAQS